MSKNSEIGDHGFKIDVVRSTIPQLSRPRSIRRLIFAISVTAILFLVYLPTRRETFGIEETVLRYLSLSSEEQEKLHDSQLAILNAGLKQCAYIKEQPVTDFDAMRKNPRAVQGTPPILIRNATLIDGDGSVFTGYCILLSNGVISKIGPAIEAPENAKVLDVHGRYVSPGLVDMVRALRSQC
jgi:hypothetical protein